MTQQRKNKYYKRCHILEKKFREILQCFSNDFNAFEAYKITSISHRTCKVIYVVSWDRVNTLAFRRRL
jgi:hypothetical protein